MLWTMRIVTTPSYRTGVRPLPTRAALMFIAALLASAPASTADAHVQPGSTADDDSPSDRPPPRADWTLRVEPVAWFVAASGDVKLPASTGSGSTDTFDLESIDLDENVIAPAGFIHFKFNNWRISVGGLAFSTDDNGANTSESGRLGDLTLAVGDATRSSLDFWSAEFQVAYRVVDERLGTTQDGRTRLAFGVEPFIGARVTGVDFEVRALSGASAGSAASHDDTFFEPIVGVKLEGEFAERFTVDFTTDFGFGPWGDDQSFSWDIMVGGAWRPFENVGVRIGYRQLLVDLESGNGPRSFEYSGALAGLMIGVELRF